MSLKEKSISGVKWTSFSAGFNVLMAVSKTAIMARLLTPTDFGLMAMLEGVMVFGRPMADMGLGMAIIQAKDITSKQLSTIYWLNVGLGAFVFITMVLISPFVADFYEEEQLTGLLTLFAVSLFIGPIGAQFNVLFQKELNFGFPIKIDFVGNIVNFVTAIVLAYYGWGVYALVFGKLARTVVNTALIVIYGLQFHRPQLYFNLREVKHLISFGGFQMGERYTQLLAGNLDKILIGKLLGAEPLGYYNIAHTLVAMPVFTINPIVNKVLFPVFSKIKDNAAKINSYYSKALKLLMSINVPLYIGIIIVAGDFIFFYVGPDWAPAIPVLRIVAITILFTSVGNPGNTVLQAKGRSDLGFYYGIIRAVTVTIFILCAFYIQNSLISIAIAILINRYTIGFIWHYMIIKFGGINYSSIITDFFRFALFSLIMTLAIFVFNSLFMIELVTLRLFLNICLGIIVYTLLIVFFDRDIMRLFAEFIKVKKS